jgi:hypothetical protein
MTPQEKEHARREQERQIRLRVQLRSDRTYMISNSKLDVGSIVVSNDTYTPKSVKGAVTDRAYWISNGAMVYELETRVVGIRRDVDLKDITNEQTKTSSSSTSSICGDDKNGETTASNEEWDADAN